MSNSKEIKESLDKVKTLTVLSESEGGQLLKRTYLKEVVNSLDKLAYNFATFSHIEMVAECANLKSKLEILRSFQNAKRNQVVAEQDLEEALKLELES